ncbi:unnamed protein product [Amoebophrya sp. A25]|nr:unnamed protein product [Amoebophrya sp. A25]|eukprot:GSA25T00026705001.1
MISSIFIIMTLSSLVHSLLSSPLEPVATTTNRRNIATSFDIVALPPPGGVLKYHQRYSSPHGANGINGDAEAVVGANSLSQGQAFGMSGGTSSPGDDDLGNLGQGVVPGSTAGLRNPTGPSVRPPEGDVWLVLDEAPEETNALVETDIFNKRWMHITDPKSDPMGINCLGSAHSLPMHGPNAGMASWRHPAFLFNRRVHKVHVTLNQKMFQPVNMASEDGHDGEREEIAPKLLWDAVYKGTVDSEGSDFELAGSAVPDGGGKMPYFRKFCPPVDTRSEYQLCVADEDNDSWKECYNLVVGGVRPPGEKPRLKPKMHSVAGSIAGPWEGLLPVKDLGYAVQKENFYTTGQVDAPVPDFVGEYLSPISGGLTSFDGTLGASSGGVHGISPVLDPHGTHSEQASTTAVPGVREQGSSPEDFLSSVDDYRGGGQASTHRTVLPGRLGKPRYPFIVDAYEDEGKAPPIPMQFS